MPYGRRTGHGHEEAAGEQVQGGVRQGNEEAEGRGPRPARGRGHGPVHGTAPALAGGQVQGGTGAGAWTQTEIRRGSATTAGTVVAVDGHAVRPVHEGHARPVDPRTQSQRRARRNRRERARTGALDECVDHRPAAAAAQTGRRAQGHVPDASGRRASAQLDPDPQVH